jgi:hypothetical protein
MSADNSLSLKKRVMLVTLFENQVIRNYVHNGQGEFFRELREKYEIIVLTNENLNSKVNNCLKIIFPRDPIEVISIDKPKSNFGYKVGQMLARCLNASESNTWSIKRNYELGQLSRTGMKIRKAINLLLSQKRSAVVVCRWLLKHSHGISKLDSLTLNSKKPDLVLLTSATNYDWDARLGSFCNQRKIKSITIPRSWDNLTSHGILRYEPSYLFTFTEPMSWHAKNFHFLTKTHILSAQNPAYHYLKLDSKLTGNLNSNNVNEIVYACTGEAIYTTELQLLNLIHNYLIESKIDVRFTILEHPKFRYPDSTKEKFHKFIWICLPYEESFSNPNKLYEILYSADYVLTAGSSIVLDTLLVNKVPICVFIEPRNSKYWLSILRYTDTVQHFVEYLRESNVIQIKNIFDLFEFFKEIIRFPRGVYLLNNDRMNQLQIKFGLKDKTIASKILQIEERT